MVASSAAAITTLLRDLPTLLVGVLWLVGLLAGVWGAVLLALRVALSRFPALSAAASAALGLSLALRRRPRLLWDLWLAPPGPATWFLAPVSLALVLCRRPPAGGRFGAAAAAAAAPAPSSSS